MSFHSEKVSFLRKELLTTVTGTQPRAHVAMPLRSTRVVASRGASAQHRTSSPEGRPPAGELKTSDLDGFPFISIHFPSISPDFHSFPELGLWLCPARRPRKWPCKPQKGLKLRPNGLCSPGSALPGGRANSWPCGRSQPSCHAHGLMTLRSAHFQAGTEALHQRTSHTSSATQ